MDELDMAAIVHRPPLAEVVSLARVVTETPIAGVALSDTTGQWHAASSGVARSDVPFDLIATLASGSTVAAAVEDIATGVDGTAESRALPLGVRSAAFAPVVAPDGDLAGYLFVLDTRPRQFAPGAIDSLGLLANQVERLLDAAVEQHHLRDLSFRLVEGEQALSESLERLEVSNRELEHFAFFAAHELQAPLRAVAAFAAVLEDAVAAGGADPELLIRISAQVQAEGARLRDQVAGLMALSTAGSEDESPTALGVLDVLGRVVDMFRDDMIVDVIGGVDVDVLGTAAGLEAVFSNLLSNASRYRHPDRPVEVEITVLADDELVTVAIADNGVGIADANLSRIFEAFQRVDRTSEGAGIGLTLCRRIAERLGGTVTVTSEPDVGSVFSVELHRAPPR